MSSDFPGHYSSAYTNLDQPFSGYSNGTAAFHQGGGNQRQGAEGRDPKATQSQHQPQQRFDISNNQAIMATSNNANASAINAPTPFAVLGATPWALQRPIQTMYHPTYLGGLPAGWETDKFWKQRATFTLSSGQPVTDTVANFYQRYPSSHEEIWQDHRSYHQKQAELVRKEQLQHLNMNPLIPRVAEEKTFTKSTPKSGRTKKTASTSRKKTCTAVAAAPTTNQVAPYTPHADLDTPQKCRDYLAYVDPADVLTLTIPDDDWQDVLRNRKHEFIGGIFEALTHPYAQNAPAGIVLNDDATKKYHTQQKAQTTKVSGLLQTTCQIKAAKALCSVLFDAAVYVHEGGVPKEMYDMYHWYVDKERQVDRKYRLDLESICSARLEKIIDGVKANKLIATDVLEQTNYHRMARDPEFYLLEKFTYLRSNKTRQEKIEGHNKKNAENEDRYERGAEEGFMSQRQAGIKRKREGIEQATLDADFEEPDDALEDFDGDVFEPPFDFMLR